MKLRTRMGGYLLFCGLLPWAFPHLMLAQTEPAPIKVAVVRSTGTLFLGQTIWNDLNTGWNNFGNTPVQIDYTSLSGYGLTLDQIQATGADVLIMSAPGYMGYTTAEIAAVKQYVESGHGLIYTYGLFRSADKALAPLVGLSEAITLGTGTATEPFWLTPTIPDHPLFAHVDQPYVSGVRTTTTLWGSPPWPVDGGIVVAELANDVIVPRPGIVADESNHHRGLYFSYYIENKSGGSNRQDMQVFYNALVWAGTPEPASAMLFIIGLALLTRRRSPKSCGGRFGFWGKGWDCEA